MIKIENLSKKYGENIVFENVSFFFKENSITAVMGKSGSGKTTLLRIIMGLEEYTGNSEGLKYKKIGAVFQEDRLCENLSAITNVSMVCKKGTATKKIKEELESIGLKGNTVKPVKELSGGMKRRVAIVRSIMAEPDIIVFDEPFKGLDIETREEVISYLREKLENRTVIIVTHDIEEARALNAEIINI